MCWYLIGGTCRISNHHPVIVGIYECKIFYNIFIGITCECSNEPSGSIKCREFLD